MDDGTLWNVLWVEEGGAISQGSRSDHIVVGAALRNGCRGMVTLLEGFKAWVEEGGASPG